MTFPCAVEQERRRRSEVRNNEATNNIETSIPSFYHEIRTEPEMAARRSWTREWWEQQSYHYELVTSLAVIEELENGDYPTKSDALSLMESIPFLPVEDSIVEIIEAYIARKLMPIDVTGDGDPF